MRRLLLVLREAMLSSWNQPVASLLSAAIVAGMCVAVLVTSGKSVGAQQSILRSLDSAGTRSIVIRAEPDAGLTSRVVSRLALLQGVEWFGAFGPATDVTNDRIPGGAKAPLRHAWLSDRELVLSGRTASLGVEASESALTTLGLQGVSGSAVESRGATWAVVGEFDVPPHLQFLDPMILLPQSESTEGDVSVLVVIASRPELTEPVADAVRSILGVTDPAKIAIESSEGLAKLRTTVDTQLSDYGRGLTGLTLLVSGCLIATVLLGMVLLRRKDFGRRRALGATRTLIVGLVVGQAAIASLVGAILGAIISVASLSFMADPLPSPEYFVAVGTLGSLMGVVASVVPAVIASRRDPIRELRVP